MPKRRSKRYKESLAQVPEGKVSLVDGVNAVKSFPAGKFDPTIELSMHLGIDPKQADQALRGSISLPHGIGATRRVVAFCEDADVPAATEAGAVEAGNQDLVQKIQDGWMEFDVAVATPAVMKNVSRLGRILGPQGKMPSPKAGTVNPDVATAVREYAAGKLEYRNDDGGNLHVAVGKASFEAEKLLENIEAFLSHVRSLRPASTKGTYIRKVCLSATMSPSVQIDLQYAKVVP